MNLNIKIFFLLIVFSVLSLFIYGQNSRRNLENKRKELNKQIESTAKILNQTAKNRKQGVQELSALQEQAKSRAELISLIREELDSINSQLGEKQQSVDEMTEKLEIMKAAYKKVLILLYRYKSNNHLIYFILSSERFNKAFEKQLYLTRLEKKRSRQAALIRKTQRSVKLDISELEQRKAEKSALLEEELEQTGTLTKELEEKDKIVRDLKSKEHQLKRELAAKEDSKRQLNNKIENIIRDQIAATKSSSRSYDASKNKGKESKNEPKKDRFLSSPDYSKSGGSFAGRKGSLPPPVSGAIVSRFGKQQHPLFEQVFTYNNGIDIRTTASANVKAVHQGTVVSVFAVPGNGNAVMLKHGNYYTTYSNLDAVHVKRGEELKAGQSLGSVAKDSESGNYLLHFELWNGKNKENPEHWLR